VKHFKEVVRATTPEEAVRLREAAGTRGLYLAGGTMVVPLAAKAVEVLVDISRLDLARIEARDGEVSLGALTQLADLVTPQIKSALPTVYDAARGCATPIIRNMATVGGALAVAHLPSDLAVAMLALGARLELAGARSGIVRLEDLLKQGWLRGHDLVVKVTAPAPRRGRGTHFAKFGRTAIDIALVNVAVSLDLAPNGKIESLRLAVGQSNSLPVVWGDGTKEVAEEAKGEVISKSIIANVARKAAGAVKPRSDFRASGEYRQHLVEVLVARSLASAAREAGARLDD